MEDSLAEREKRYQVFVSSTFLDLRDARQKVIEVLISMQALPVGMELFPPADEAAWDAIKRVIDDTDYYLLIVAGKYGSTDPDGKSYTEKEYDYAISKGKPVMAFLFETPSSLPEASVEIDPEARDRLVKFRDKVKNQRLVKYWTSPEDLVSKIAIAYGPFTRTYQTVGWIRANQASSPETLEALTSALQRVKELETQISKLGTSEPTTAQGLASGEEHLSMTVESVAEYTEQVAHRTDSGEEFTVDEAERVRIASVYTLSWNEISATIGDLIRIGGPASIDEVSTALSKEIEVRNYRDLKHSAEQFAYDEQGFRNRDVSFSKFVSIDVVRQDIITAVTQLEALGILRSTFRKGAWSNNQPVWVMTPWGSTQYSRLRAVPTGSSVPLSRPASAAASQIRTTVPPF